MASWVYRIALLIPLFYWVSQIFFGDLGAEPTKTLSHWTGEMALYYLWFNLAIGALIGFSFRWPAWSRFLLRHRRYLGVLTFLILVIHLFMYFALEAFEFNALEQIVTKTYLIFGSLAWLILLVLALTSNNISIRKLGGRRWKQIHRTVYLASFFVSIHVLLIEKTDLIKYGALVSLLWIVQLTRFARFLKKKMQKKSGPKGRRPKSSGAVSPVN